MEFKNWLEIEERPIFVLVSKTLGVVKILLRNKMYAYRTDAIFHHDWERLVRYKPMTAFNLAKEGQRLNPNTLEPLKLPPKDPLPKDPPMKQKFLF